MDMNEATAKAIAAERAIAGITVRELAKRSGIPESSLNRVLGAQRDIKVNQIHKLAEVLGVYPHEIIEHAENLMDREQSRRPTPSPADDGVVVTFPAAPPDEDDEDEPDWTTFAARTNPHHDQEITERTGWRDDLGEETQVGPDWDKED